MNNTIESVDALVQRIHIMQAEQSSGQRLIIAIAGAPGSGKSTLATQVCERLNDHPGSGSDSHADCSAGLAAGSAASPAASPPENNSPVADRTTVDARETAVVVPMDGFHLDNIILRERDQMAVKGSPLTYDVRGFGALLQRLSECGEGAIYIPLFDRQADLARNAAQVVDGRHSIVIVEGNYLFLARPGWQELATFFHLSIMLDVPMATLEERLIQRWLDYGLEPEMARARALQNDIPNAKVVLRESTGTHLYYKSMRQ